MKRVKRLIFHMVSGASPRGPYSFRPLLLARALVAAALGLALSTAALAATITVNSLADPGSLGICTLRDAITAVLTAKTLGGQPVQGQEAIQIVNP